MINIRKRDKDKSLRNDLDSGKQRRLVYGSANSGSGTFPFFGCSGTKGPSIAAPAQYNISNISKGARISIGSVSSVNSHNMSSVTDSNNTTTSTNLTSNHGDVQSQSLKKRVIGPVDHNRVKEVIELMDDDDNLYEAFKYTAERRAEDGGMKQQRIEVIEDRHSTYSFSEKKNVLECVDKIQASSACSRREAMEMYRSMILAQTSMPAPSRSTINDWARKEENGNHMSLMKSKCIVIT